MSSDYVVERKENRINVSTWTGKGGGGDSKSDSPVSQTEATWRRVVVKSHHQSPQRGLGHHFGTFPVPVWNHESCDHCDLSGSGFTKLSFDPVCNQSCSLCRLQTHQWCFLLFNVLLFHALLFGADFVEEYLLQPTPGVYTDSAVADVREKARKLDLSHARENVSQAYPIANPNACRSSNLFLLVLVFSSTANVSQRNAVRRTWGNQTLIQGVPVQVLFFLGSTQTYSAQQALERESERYGDMVQGHTVADSSLRGPTERTVLALCWVIAFCPVARFVLLTKESVFVNLPAIGGYLLGLHRHPEDLYLGRVIQRVSPDRSPDSPSYLPPALYPDKYLPEYCDGTAYVLSQDVVRKVYVGSARISVPLPEGVFVGLCAQKAGVAPTHSARFTGEKHVRYNACCYRYLFSSAGMTSQELDRVWEDLGQEEVQCSLLQTYYGLVTCKALTYLEKLSFFSPNGEPESHG
ncbi:beta-1,3-galactosyltransferase 9 [Antennarius striatus]|uniref:beta-1,3-galactosyltransferase 9 n=1 Tax=Antennarius striatus TaxID=241820 RepID=UPI0035B38D77